METACRLLSEARSLDEVKTIRNTAEAARIYARQVQLGLEAQNDAAERERMFAHSGGDPTVPAIVVDGAYLRSGWGDPPRG